LAEQGLVLDARYEYKALKAENLTKQQALDSDFISIFISWNFAEINQTICIKYFWIAYFGLIGQVWMT